MSPDPIFIRVSGGRILLKNTNFYPSQPEEFDENFSIFIQTYHEGSWCTFRGPVYTFTVTRSGSSGLGNLTASVHCRRW
jgi:hypothetical protein